jgi:hypothetical protein
VHFTTAVFEFANVSDSPITINHTDLELVKMGSTAESITGSKIKGGPITVKPGTIETITVTGKHEPSVVIVDIFGINRFYKFYDEPITDEMEGLTPYDNTDMYFGHVVSPGIYISSGNGKFKVQPKESILLENKSIGPITKPEKGAIGVVKVRFANTSDEAIHIDSFHIWSADTDKPDDTMEYVFTSQEMKLLGDQGLPMHVEPKSEVVGYVPYFIRNMNEVSGFYARTSAGEFNINTIDGYNLWVK